MKRNIVKMTICLTVYLLSSTQILLAQNLTDEIVLKAATPLVEDELVDGLSIGYIQGDQSGTVHLGHSSSAQSAEETTADDSSIYELGSISKVFTSLMLADAVVRGEIKLDGDASVDNSANIKFPTLNYRSVKWIDLSTHRSGLPRLPDNLVDKSLTDPYRLYDSTKAAAALSKLKLPRSPGDSQEYSNFAVSVLGYLVGENSGKSYQDLLQERIAQPLSMTDCTVALSEDQKNRLATPHVSFGTPTPKWNWADLPGAGGVCASMNDMMRFAKAQLNPPEGKLGEAIELAWTQHTKADDSGPAMGLGWMILGDGETHWHNGGTGGSRTMMLINRKEKLAIVALCNTAAMHEMDQLVMELRTLASGKGLAEVSASRAGNGKTPSKVSPFTSVGFHEEKVFVAYAGKTYLWQEIDDIPVKKIVAASKKNFGDRWQKRISEDLVEVLWTMDHKPGDTVKLQLQDFKTKKESVIDSAPMTEANRRLVWQERNKAKGKIGAAGAANGVKIDAEHRARLEGRYKLAENFIFDVKDRGGRLMVGITNQPTQQVFPDSKTHWSYRGVKATLEFKLPNKGAAKSLILHQNGIEQTAKRMGK